MSTAFLPPQQINRKMLLKLKHGTILLRLGSFLGRNERSSLKCGVTWASCGGLSFRTSAVTATSSETSHKTQLSKLRKKTGFPFVKCKLALEKYNYDSKLAEQWLKEQAVKEGWNKASKLEQRPMACGLVGVVTCEGRQGAMVEVSCETDFVARNAKFHRLVTMATSAFLKHSQRSGQQKILLSSEALSAVQAADTVSADASQTLGDLLAAEIGSIGENMTLRRAAYLQVSEHLRIGSYVHSADSNVTKGSSCRLGKYGALVSFEQSSLLDSVCAAGTDDVSDVKRLGTDDVSDVKRLGTDDVSDVKRLGTDDVSDVKRLGTDEVGQLLGQHIVGMKPLTVGDPDADAPNDIKDEETALIHQEFLLDSDLTVREFVQLHGVTVHDFVRYECGEDISNIDPTATD